MPPSQAIEAFDIDDASSSLHELRGLQGLLSQSDNTIGLVPLMTPGSADASVVKYSLCERGNSNHLLRCGAVLGVVKDQVTGVLCQNETEAWACHQSSTFGG